MHCNSQETQDKRHVYINARYKGQRGWLKPLFLATTAGNDTSGYVLLTKNRTDVAK